MEYAEFIASKAKWTTETGFQCGTLLPGMYDFQKYLTEWSCRVGRSAILADCGLGKTVMQLAFADQCVRRENKSALILTPLAVGLQTVDEAHKFGLEAYRVRDGMCDHGTAIYVTNYEQLHKFDQSQFCCVVCDESSCIKDFKSERKDTVVEFMRRMPYRLLCTATAAPNDYHELGTSSEALGYLGYRDMITKFFKQADKGYKRFNAGCYATKYRFRGHAEQPFWSWVCSWARSMRKPEDAGFDGTDFILPELIQNEYVIAAATARPGQLFAKAAECLEEERAERRHTIRERCEKAVALATAKDGPAVVWCELNDEGNLLEHLLPECVQVKGSMSDDEREEALIAFTRGQIKRMVCKPKIGAWGLNWQHCNNVVSLPSHSFEQMYQAVRRCYRFGQKKPVTVSLVVSEGEQGILDNLKRKQQQSENMFQSIVAHMNDAMHLVSRDYFPEKEVLPSWL